MAQGSVGNLVEGSRVLIVDDEPEIVEYLKMVLEGHGMDCVGVFSPLDGIDAANKERFAAIISDMRMPKMTGTEMIAHIRTSLYNAKTPIVVLSGALTDDTLTNLERIGVIDVMSKPPDVDVLVRIIQKGARTQPKKTGKIYNPNLIKAVHDGFVKTLKGHLADKVQLSEPHVNETPLLNIEYCGMVTVLGRRLSGVISISYQTGFTAEFAKIMMGREAVGKEWEIFETSSGEIAEQIGQSIIPVLKNMGLHVEVTAPLVVHGRHATIPLPGSLPRISSAATLNQKCCYLEFAFTDMAEDFAGRADAADFKIILGT